MAVELIDLEVAYGKADRQTVVALTMPAPTTVAEAITASGILEEFPEIDLQQQKVGVFSQLCRLETVVSAGQRIEIYRPLQQNPMDARRNKMNTRK